MIPNIHVTEVRHPCAREADLTRQINGSGQNLVPVRAVSQNWRFGSFGYMCVRGCEV